MRLDIIAQFAAERLQPLSYYAIYGSQFLTTIIFWFVALAAWLVTKRHRRARRRAATQHTTAGNVRGTDRVSPAIAIDSASGR